MTSRENPEPGEVRCFSRVGVDVTILVLSKVGRGRGRFRCLVLASNVPGAFAPGGSLKLYRRDLLRHDLVVVGNK